MSCAASETSTWTGNGSGTTSETRTWRALAKALAGPKRPKWRQGRGRGLGRLGGPETWRGRRAAGRADGSPSWSGPRGRRGPCASDESVVRSVARLPPKHTADRVAGARRGEGASRGVAGRNTTKHVKGVDPRRAPWALWPWAPRPPRASPPCRAARLEGSRDNDTIRRTSSLDT